MQDSISVNNEEDNLIKELRNTSVFTKEKLLYFKTDVINTFEVISMEPGNDLYIEVTKDVLDHLESTTLCTLEELEKLQQKDMLLLQQLDHSNHEKFEQRVQLEDKEEEIKSLKTKLTNLIEEMDEVKTHKNKRKEVLKESEECYVNIYPMDEVEEELSKAKQKVDWSLYVYHFDHNDSDYSFLHDYTK
jgi:hypothetical protein